MSEPTPSLPGTLPGTLPQLRVAVAALLIVLLAAVAYSFHAHHAVRQLSRQNNEMTANLSATRDQVNALSTKLNDMTAELAVEKTAPLPLYRKPVTAAVQRQRIDSSHWKKIQAQLDEQGKQIATNREDLVSARTELGSSIAKTHDELTALERKGERNYYEFDVDKDGKFQRKGPIGIRLRKTSTKHKYADLEVMVDDFKLSKKHIDVYEPVVFYLADTKLPAELVINKIGKDHIHGYVSEAKYKSGDVQAMDNASVGDTAAAATSGQSASPSKPSPAQEKVDAPRTN
jgi:hypothetical protein